MGILKGELEGLGQSAKTLDQYSSDLNDTLTKMKAAVDDFTADGDKESRTAGINGESNVSMFKTYNGLHADLMEFVRRLTELSSGISSDAAEMDDMDRSGATLSYDGGASV